MTGIGALLCLVFSGLGPDGLLLSRDLLQMEGPLALPLTTLARTAEELWLVPHEEADWSRAFFTPPESALYFALLGRTERLLGGLEVPRLFVHSSYARDGPEGGYALANMAVDSAEYLLNALVEAHLAREMTREGSPYRQVVERRVGELLPQVPPEYRVEAYLAATADFGAHILSIAHEVNRAARRAKALEKDPCALLERHVPLLSLWETGFERARFTGRYARPVATSEKPGTTRRPGAIQWVETRQSLERLDKELFVRHMLGGVWQGKAEHDFARLCAS